MLSCLLMSQQHQQMTRWGILIQPGLFALANQFLRSLYKKSGGHNYNWQWKGKCWHWEEKWGVISLIFLICGSPRRLRGYSISPDKSPKDIPPTQTATHKDINSLYYLHLVSLLVYFELKRAKAFSFPSLSQVNLSLCKNSTFLLWLSFIYIMSSLTFLVAQ